MECDFLHSHCLIVCNEDLLLPESALRMAQRTRSSRPRGVWHQSDLKMTGWFFGFFGLGFYRNNSCELNYFLWQDNSCVRICFSVGRQDNSCGRIRSSVGGQDNSCAGRICFSVGWQDNSCINMFLFVQSR